MNFIKALLCFNLSYSSITAADSILNEGFEAQEHNLQNVGIPPLLSPNNRLPTPPTTKHSVTANETTSFVSPRYNLRMYGIVDDYDINEPICPSYTLNCYNLKLICTCVIGSAVLIGLALYMQFHKI
ncbi:MAG: hypothetical protein KBD31_06015 [Proteobacteria bacterium]|nr:hypothetical protein [Pseudomonadota bacterium]